MTVRQFDVQTAFLNGDPDEEIFMKLPPGMNIDNKQSANAWHNGNRLENRSKRKSRDKKLNFTVNILTSK